MDEQQKYPKTDSGEALYEWLENKPAQWSLTIAARAAQRVVPLSYNRILASRNNEIQLDLTVAMLRANIISWVAGNP